MTFDRENAAIGGQPPKDLPPAGLTPPGAILFDWDNTLVDTWGVIHRSLNHTLTTFGLEAWTEAETKARVRKSMRDSFPALFGSDWEEAGRTFYAYFRAHHLDGLTPKAGAADMLADLKERGLYLGVVSNKTGDILRTEARHLGWDRYFESLVGAGDAVRDKPDSAPIHLALSKWEKGTGSNVWFAGDADIDLDCGRRAGLTTILIRQEPPAPGEMADCPPDWHVPDCIHFSRLVTRP
ncbi:MAG: HAD family hydrolase [Rhodospirillales bacterium]